MSHPQLLRSDVDGRFAGFFDAQYGRLDVILDSPPTAPRVLLIEDERSIRELVSEQLRRAGYDCRSVGDGREGLQLLREERFDAIVLDLMLPHVDGLTICRTVRRQGANRDAPILMLTARITESDKVLGLESGADDYMTKPFGVLELTARIAALTRRVHRAQTQAAVPARRAVTAHQVALDPIGHTVRVRGRDVAVTPHEFELLYQLASQPGVVFSRKALLAAVWRGQAFVTDRSIDTLVRHLRCKVEENAAEPTMIVTIWGYGYKFFDA